MIYILKIFITKFWFRKYKCCNFIKEVVMKVMEVFGINLRNCKKIS